MVANVNDIRAIGNFLASYETDLIYIRNFKRYRRNEISTSEFVKKESGSFYSFLIEFNVTRNFIATKSGQILEFSNDWLNRENNEDVDDLADQLQYSGLTHRGKMTSLASKILFLNNPYKVFPMDRRAKKTLRHTTDNLYKNYLPKIRNYRINKSSLIQDALNIIEPFTKRIEVPFSSEIGQISEIRVNRFIDKLLWTGEIALADN